MYLVLVHYVNSQIGKVLTGVLSIPALTKDSRGANIFEILDSKLNLSCEYCLSFCSDNALVTLRKYNGVAAYLLEKAPKCFINGCHLSAIGAKIAAKKLSVRIDELFVDINCHLKGSYTQSRELTYGIPY